MQPEFPRGAVPQRVMQPVAQQAAAHAGLAGIQHREQRGCGLSAQRFGQFQIAPGGGVQPHEIRHPLHGHAAQVSKARALGEPRVLQQCAGGGDGQWKVVAAEPREIAGAELAAEQLLRRRPVELPVGQAFERDAAALKDWEPCALRQQDLRRPDPLQFRGEGGELRFHDPQGAGSQVQPGKP